MPNERQACGGCGGGGGILVRVVRASVPIVTWSRGGQGGIFE